MRKRTRQLLGEWQIPHIEVGGVTLVNRADWKLCVLRIFNEQCAFHGYEMFKLFEDRIQPDMGWSASWASSTLPTSEEILAQLYEAPNELGYVEFVFSKNW